jgi:hypothetical protein
MAENNNNKKRKYRKQKKTRKTERESITSRSIRAAETDTCSSSHTGAGNETSFIRTSPVYYFLPLFGNKVVPPIYYTAVYGRVCGNTFTVLLSQVWNPVNIL